MLRVKILIIFSTLLVVAYQNCGQVSLEKKVEASKVPEFSLSVKVCNFEDYETKVFYAYNRNFKFQDGYYYTDSDGDGLSDEFEEDSLNQEKYGLSSQVRDSNLDGFDDLIVVRFDMNIDQQNNLPVCEDLTLDSDRDGINDCTEDLINTDKYKPDTDADNIPDRLEVLNALNALDARDASSDVDGDGVNNLDEIKLGTPVLLSNANYPNQQIKSSMEVLIGEGCRLLTFEKLPFYSRLNPNHFVIEILEQNLMGEVILRKVNYLIDVNDYPQGQFNIDLDDDLILEGRSGGAL